VRPTLSNDINSTTVKDTSKSGAQSAAVLPVIALALAFVASFNSVFGSIYTEYLFKNTPGLSFGQQQVSILPQLLVSESTKKLDPFKAKNNDSAFSKRCSSLEPTI